MVLYGHKCLQERSLFIEMVQVDTVISQAQETLGALMFQRSTFGGINSKLSNVSSRIPTVSKLTVLYILLVSVQMMFGERESVVIPFDYLII